VAHLVRDADAAEVGVARGAGGAGPAAAPHHDDERHDAGGAKARGDAHGVRRRGNLEPGAYSRPRFGST